MFFFVLLQPFSGIVQWRVGCEHQPAEYAEWSSKSKARTKVCTGFICELAQASSKRERQKERQKSHSSSVSPSSTSEVGWNISADEDITPQAPVFRPSRTPGPQLLSTASYTVLQLFQLFFSSTMMETIVKNTNVYGVKQHNGKKHGTWKKHGKIYLWVICIHICCLLYTWAC